MKQYGLQKALETSEITSEQLEKINRLTRRPLTSDEVFVFPLVLCDNEVDRDFERFTPSALEKLGELFLGKTGVFDHDPKAKNQSARIFDTQLLAGEDKTSTGEGYVYLRALAYMVRCDKNADLILEIDAGIIKEVSVGCAVDKVTCSVCGANQKTAVCAHVKGKTYDGILCVHLLEDPTDAYEWSFVAVPAQKKAGVTKGGRRGYAGGATMDLTRFLQAQETHVGKEQMERLQKEFHSLQELARAGEASLAKLRQEVVTLAGLCQPYMDLAVAEKAYGALDFDELASLRKSFSKAVGERLPIGLQLAPGNRETSSPSQDSFKI